ncbi:MAG: benzoate-CoA ligase [Solirubrobacterales bacterium]|nr:benzoate-CoA ligase [Solirubrobacterales bacterium]
MSVHPAEQAAQNANASLVLDRRLEAGGGDSPAYVSDRMSLSYAELLREVARMGNLLRAIGVRREERVLLVLDDTPLFPAAFIGAMRIGAVPVPVSVREHGENFRHFIEDCYARVVVCEEPLLAPLRASLAGLDVRFLTYGGPDGDPAVLDLGTALAEQEDECEAVPTHPDDMAFWLYTSGSTGRPKGVVHLHKSIAAVCESFGREIFELTAEDRVFSTTKLYHSYGLGNSFAYPLYFGASAVLLEGTPAPERLLDALRRHRPTVLCSVPALYRQLVDDPDTDGALDSVRICISAAEPLPVGTFERWRDRFGMEILDGIGATEMFVTFCSNRLGDVAPGTTGRAVPGYELRLLDELGAEVPGEGEGALQVRGASRAAHYWHQQERTRVSMPGEWLTTGDRFRRREDGRYVYVGRSDDMLKVGGLWVSPIDMELAISEHAGVSGVAVVGARIDDYMRLAAFVEAAPDAGDAQQLTDELRELCRERLREHEQPHLIRFVDALPRTVNGKPRRFMLRAQIEQELGELASAADRAAEGIGSGAGDQARPVAGLGQLDPAERERALLELIGGETATLLGLASAAIDPSRSFAQLGVDSLMAVELRNRIAAASGLRIASTLVFDHPTPVAAARALSAEAEGRAAPAAELSAAELAALAELDAGPGRTRMPGGSLGFRLKSSAVLNALVPARVAVRRAMGLAPALWELDEEDREQSCKAIAAVVADTVRADEQEQLAKAHLAEALAYRALFWQRPWTARIDPDSSRRIDQALASGRGVLLSACHIGPYQRLDRVAPFRRRRTYLVPGAWYFERPSPGQWGRRLARWRKATKSLPVRASGSFRIVQALLERGEAVFLFFDLPGPRQTRFLGKPAMLADGTAQLSVRTGALVLPLRARREGHHAHVQAAPAIDPRDLDGVDQLHARLAEIHAAWILENPAAMEDPREVGWGDGATAEAWIAPVPARGD